jgi:hypothetical protein
MKDKTVPVATLSQPLGATGSTPRAVSGHAERRKVNGPAHGSAGVISRFDTRAYGGPLRQAASIVSTLSAGPQNNASTSPLARLRTHPERPSALA